jgi:hypothetical protein
MDGLSWKWAAAAAIAGVSFQCPGGDGGDYGIGGEARGDAVGAAPAEAAPDDAPLVTTSCTTVSDHRTLCKMYTIAPSTAASEEADCRSQGGTVGGSCDATALDGCCEYVGLRGIGEVCFYDGPEHLLEEKRGCAQAAGSWRTTL